jgi:AmmeMemoRadiSam system protein A
MAIQAATGDPRFPSLTESELDQITLEISVLSPVEQIDDINKIQVGKHGLIIRKGFNAGLLLPQVAIEYNWTRQEFLEHTCLKAGLGPNQWKQGAKISIFSAEVFGEEQF